MKKLFLYGVLCATAASAGLAAQAKESEEFAAKVIRVHRLAPARAQRVRALLLGAPGLTRNIGDEDPARVQGPNNSWHMASRQACVDKVIATGLIRQNPEFEKICGAPWMAPVPVPGQPLARAKVCIDQFEFPDIPCEYPVVWSTSALAKQICEGMGKRACNSHEWEGACTGSAEPLAAYRFDIADRSARRRAVNADRPLNWAFQFQNQLARVRDTRGLCAVYTPNDPEIGLPMRRDPSRYYSAIGKSVTCFNGKGSDYKNCGTNTWPSGFKYDCRSAADVFDMHGNVAEVVNLPGSPAQLADMQGHAGGGTERKGSFFVYRSGYPDDCRVRQPYEHFGSYTTDHMSYYQEGFRCCKDVE
jgi:hypothetical protein